MTIRRRNLAVAILAIGAAAAIVAHGCEGRSGRGKPRLRRSDVEEAAIKTYVPPGDLDQYYVFYSGGHSGNVYVAGLPSMRHICTIPVFTP